MSSRKSEKQRRNQPVTLQQEIQKKEYRAEFFQGPLPPPETLEKYEKLQPGLINKIVAQADRQTNHRIDMEKRVIKSDIVKSYMGLVFAFVIGVGGIGGGIFITTLGHDVFGPILSTGSLASLVYAFIYGTKTRKEERTARVEQLGK